MTQALSDETSFRTTNPSKTRHIKKGHVCPVLYDSNGLKFNPLAEFSEEASLHSVSIKSINIFYDRFKKISAIWIYMCDLSISLLSSEILSP